MCTAAPILISKFYKFDHSIVMNVGENALVEFLDTLIVWETAIVAKVRTIRALNRLSGRQQD